jgi:polysaccharide export outer membrane protein
MSHGRTGALLAGFTLAICVLTAGCHSTSSHGSLIAHHSSSGNDTRTAAKGPVLSPGMELAWNIKTVHETPNVMHAGRSVVGPDGALEMGPYGSCRVSGMTVSQASATLEKHLTKYLRGPVVTLDAPIVVAAASELDWRQAGSKKPGAVFAASFQAEGNGDKDKDKDKDKGSDKKELEVAPAPRTVPPAMVGANHHPGGPIAGHIPGMMTAPTECKPTLMPPYVIGPTDVLTIYSLLPESPSFQRPAGPHLVGPDGTVRLGSYGSVLVAGKTLDEARMAIAQLLFSRIDQGTDEPAKEGVKAKVRPTFENVLNGVSVDVLAYNSKQFFIILDGAGLGEQVVQLPITGNDTVLSAMSKVNGLPLVATRHHIWVARLTCPGQPDTLLPVDWIGMTKRGEGSTNWQLMPGDRIYVKADSIRTFSNGLAKVLEPVERILGVTLLGSQTVNSIRNGNVGGGTR